MQNNDLYHHLDYWFARGLGRHLLEVEKNGITNYLKKIFGYHLLQLGGPRDEQLLESSSIGNKIYLHPECISKIHDASILAKFTDLPFQPDVIDLTVVPHSLEFTKRPFKILNELYNITLPDGYVLIIGFNPFSLWGVRRVFARHRFPWCGNFIAMHKMRRYLRDVGFKVIDCKCFFYRPPFTRKAILDKLLFMEGLGQILWPHFGGVYIMLAKKSVVGMTPIREQNRRQHKVGVSPAVAKPTTRSRTQ
ncbi:MAG: hypothetical protein KAS93_06000 [Gammaproteobacteria bacterium]|nr:hypothetical protein [Gammaproteobacteria bacterium]